MYDLLQELKEVWNAWNIKCGDNDGGEEEAGIRGKEWGERRLNDRQESDHSPLYEPC